MQQNFQNPQIFDFEIPDFEDVKLKSVSKKYLNVIVVNLVILSIFLIVALGALFYYFRKNLDQLQVISISVVAFLLIVYLFLNAIIGFKFRKYAVREKDLVYQYGWLKRSIIIVPFNRIQHITVSQGWLSRIFVLKSVSVFTAGISGGNLSIKGLPEEIADGINHLIRGTINKEKPEEIEEN